MSALRLEKIVKGEHGFCLNRCDGVHGVRPGSHRAWIADHPIGVLCKKCSAAWPEMWSGAQVTLRIRTDPWPGIFLVENPIVVESAMFGPLISGRFRKEDDPSGMFEEGSFRMDRLTLIEPLETEQMTLSKAAA